MPKSHTHKDSADAADKSSISICSIRNGLYPICSVRNCSYHIRKVRKIHIQILKKSQKSGVEEKNIMIHN